jgi:hypothetical protein
MVHTTLEVKLGEDLSCFIQHLKSNICSPLLLVHVRGCSMHMLMCHFYSLDLKLEGRSVKTYMLGPN